MTDREPNMRALKREWLVARIVGGFAVLLLIAVVTVLVVSAFQTPPEAPARPVPPAEATPPADTAEARRQEDIALCDAALASAQTLGIVPAFATRDGDRSEPAGVQGRYLCHAKTDAAKYAITFDLACTHLGDNRCIVPVTIAQGGTVLYRRP
jgi:hypothetical protein